MNSSNTTINTYTPTWNYIASGLKFIIENEFWKIENKERFEHHRITEGVRIVLLISFATVVEGALKTYLIETIDKTFLEKDRIEKLLNKDTANSELQIQESETSFFPNPTKQELIKRKDENDQFIIRIKNISIEEVENSTWNNLIELFKRITGEKFKDCLDSKRKDLSEDVNAIFSFRNFAVHSNNIHLNILKENDFSFIDKPKDLIKYLKKRKFIKDDYKMEKKKFIEVLISDKLIPHFKKVVDEYLHVRFFKECHTIAN